MTAKVSSIHVNGWFGNYDKLTTTLQFLAETFNMDANHARQAFVFAGDSPNDAPMFLFFDNSIGVANISRFSGHIATPPKYVTRGAAGAGFAELAAYLLAHLPGSR